MLGLALLLMVILAQGGGGPLDVGSAAARQELAAAVAHHARAPALHLTGGFSHDGHPFRVDVTIGRGGDSQGTVVADARRVEYRYTGGHAYVLAGQDFWTSQGRLAPYLAGRWVTSPDLLADLSTSALSRSLALVDLARPGLTFTHRGRATRVNGVPAQVFSDPTGELYVSTAEPTRFLRLVSSPSYRTADGITDVRIDLDYPAAGLAVQAPGPVVDTGDDASLPARYVVDDESFEFGSCSAPSGCAVSAVVSNSRGPQVGSPSAEFQLTKADGGDLGRCTAPIHPVGHDQDETVSCTVSGSAWAQFWRVGGRYRGTVTVHNPFYDG